MGHDDRTESAATFTVSHDSRIRATSEKVTCRHYGLLRYEDSACYEIIGHPPSRGSHGRVRDRGRGSRGGRVSETKVEGETVKLHIRSSCWVLDRMCLGSSRGKELSSNKSRATTLLSGSRVIKFKNS